MCVLQVLEYALCAGSCAHERLGWRREPGKGSWEPRLTADTRPWLSWETELRGRHICDPIGFPASPSLCAQLESRKRELCSLTQRPLQARTPWGSFRLFRTQQQFSKEKHHSKGLFYAQRVADPRPQLSVCLGLLSVSVFQGLTLREVMTGNNWGPLCLLRRVSKGPCAAGPVVAPTSRLYKGPFTNNKQNGFCY